MTIDTSHYSYKVQWSHGGQEYFGTCDETPGLTWYDMDPGLALAGIMQLVKGSNRLVSEPRHDDTMIMTMARWRNVGHPDDICMSCQGSGVANYPSTSTWRGGIGGHAITADVCDQCWGSGNLYKPWLNLRNIRQEKIDSEIYGSVEQLCRMAGAGFNSTTGNVLDVANELHTFSSRHGVPKCTRNIAETLSRALIQAVDVARR